MRLTLVVSSLECGGAERVMTIMANYWAARSHTITLLTFDDGAKPRFYDLDNRVSQISLGIKATSNNYFEGFLHNVNRVRALRTAIRVSRPDAVISFVDRTNVLVLLATRGLGV